MMMMPPTSLPKRQPDGTWGAEGSSVSVYKRLWVHEVLRVVYDRLVDSTDRQWLLGQLRDTSRTCLGEGWEELMAPLLQPGSQEVGQEELRRWGLSRNVPEHSGWHVCIAVGTLLVTALCAQWAARVGNTTNLADTPQMIRHTCPSKSTSGTSH